jgi:hypothetical protein
MKERVNRNEMLLCEVEGKDADEVEVKMMMREMK